MSPVGSLASTRPVRLPDAAPTQREAFQETVGSLFYGEMLKALRRGVGKPAYLHGGQAEDLFQARMDQEVAALFARTHGGELIEELYQRFLVDHPDGGAKQPAELSSLIQASKSSDSVGPAQASAWARPLTSDPRNTTGTGVIPVLGRK